MKNELHNVISGKSKVRHGEAILAITRFLTGGQGSGEVAKDEKPDKEKEAKALKEYITQKSLWVPSIDIALYVSEGAEQKVYLADDRHVFKLNDAIYYNHSWIDYLHNLLLHNYYFPDTAYELEGFTEAEGILYAVVKQPFVKATHPTDLQTVKDFMRDNGFINTRNHDYRHLQLGIILEDLHDENVLTKDGTLYFIDTVFFITDEFHEG
jgi:hypothetical protein